MLDRQMPPLSFADKLIYWSIFLLLGAAYLILLLGPLYLRRRIAFSDAAVIASDDHASIFWLGVPWMTFFLMTFILWLQPYQDRRPIFGLKNFKYGPPAWPKAYPLFMKNKPYVWVSDRKKKERKQIAVILLMILLVSFIPFPWSLFGRDCLIYDGSIVEFNMFNSQTREFRSGDIADIEIETYRYSSGKYAKTTRWGVRMVFKTDGGGKYIFEDRDFRNPPDSQIRYWLEAMLAVKQRYDPGIVHYDGLEDLERVIADRNLNQEEIQKLQPQVDELLRGIKDFRKYIIKDLIHWKLYKIY